MWGLRLLLTVVASSLAVPVLASHGIGGVGGTLNIRVVSGFYDPDGQSGNGPIYDLAGLTGRAKFSARVWEGVSRPYSPFGYFTPYIETAIRVVINNPTLGRIGFGSGSSNSQPYYGFFYNGATFTGDSTQGDLGYYFIENGGSADNADLMYANDGATGSGTVYDGCDDVCGSSIARFDFIVTGGNVFASVPEPESWTLLVVGLGIVGASLRRKAAIKV